MSKLVRAEIPMCQNGDCGGEMERIPEGRSLRGPRYVCGSCGTTADFPWIGYHPVDVKGAVGLMRSVADAITDIPGCRDQATRLYIMAKVTEASHG